MYFGNADIEMLKLAAWCKNLPVDMERNIPSRVLEPARVRLLDAAGLLKQSDNRQCIRLRALGWDFLHHLGLEYHKDRDYRSAYQRRLESARILLTFWRAGYDVFRASIGDMKVPRVYLPSMAARRGGAPGGDIWGGAWFWGLGRLGNTVASCYHVDGHNVVPVFHVVFNAGIHKAVVALLFNESPRGFPDIPALRAKLGDAAK